MNSGNTAPEWVTDSAGTFTASYGSSTGAITTRTVDAKLEDMLSAKDFGAVGDGSTDDTTAIQNALNNNANKTVYLPKGSYRITSSLTITGNYRGLVGDISLPVLKLDLASNTDTPAIKLQTSGSSDLNEFTRIENLYIKRKVNGANAIPPLPTSPGPNNAGVVCDGSTYDGPGGVQRATLRNLRVADFATGFYFKNVVGFSVKNCLVQCTHNYSATGDVIGNSNKYWIGYHFDGTPYHDDSMSPLASIELEECGVDMSGVDGKEEAPVYTNDTKSIGFYLKGKDLRDIFLHRPETAHGRYPIWIESTTSTDWNWNIQITRPILDAFHNTGIYCKSLGGIAAVTVNGGYIVGKASSNYVWAEDCNGITLTGGIHFLGGSGGPNDGVRLKNCHSCIVSNNRFANFPYCVSLDSSEYNTISSNVISAAATYKNPEPTLAEAVRCFNTSTYNTYMSNTN